MQFMCTHVMLTVCQLWCTAQKHCILFQVKEPLLCYLYYVFIVALENTVSAERTYEYSEMYYQGSK
jgi:hypothetical protein